MHILQGYYLKTRRIKFGLGALKELQVFHRLSCRDSDGFKRTARSRLLWRPADLSPFTEVWCDAHPHHVKICCGLRRSALLEAWLFVDTQLQPGDGISSIPGGRCRPAVWSVNHQASKVIRGSKHANYTHSQTPDQSLSPCLTYPASGTGMNILYACGVYFCQHVWNTNGVLLEVSVPTFKVIAVAWTIDLGCIARKTNTQKSLKAKCRA